VAKITGTFIKIAESTLAISPGVPFPATFSFDPPAAAAGFALEVAGFAWAEIPFAATVAIANKTININDLNCTNEDLRRCDICMRFDYQN
jgi:hypothetical protein